MFALIVVLSMPVCLVFLNKIVNQQNSCALVIMSFPMLLVI
jgi:hypothetical protein